MASSASDKLLGVRDGFLRYFHDGLDRAIPVAVTAGREEESDSSGLPLSDEEAIRLARRRARSLQEKMGEGSHFFVGSEGGLHSVEVEGQLRYFVRNWTVVLGVAGEAWGGSGSVQLPESLVGGLDGEQIPFSIPGTRRRGGMISSLTGGLEERRSAIAVATLHAISTLFYGLLESRPVRRRW